MPLPRVTVIASDYGGVAVEALIDHKRLRVFCRKATFAEVRADPLLLAAEPPFPGEPASAWRIPRGAALWPRPSACW